jgi:hypothetical protein
MFEVDSTSITSVIVFIPGGGFYLERQGIDRTKKQIHAKQLGFCRVYFMFIFQCTPDNPKETSRKALERKGNWKKICLTEVCT